MNGNFGEAVLSQGALSPYQGGLCLIRAIQGFANPFLTSFMKLITNVVSDYVFFAVIMILFWLVNERKAFRLGLLVLLSAWFNTVLKVLFKQPRPFHLENDLGMIYESGYGLPSGHAQLILVFLVPLALWLVKTPGTFRPRNAFIAAVTALFVLLVSFSRLYLGLHFPQDILAGWILGGLSLALFLFLEKKEFLRSPRARLGAAAALSFLMNALNPREISLGATLFGFASGYALMKSRFPFSAKNGVSPRSAIVRLTAGFCGVLILYAGLRLIFPGPSSSWYSLFRFIRYAVIGFWVSCAAPWLFGKLPVTGSCKKAKG
ncbi:MAG: phosphatase PAP2 family protein [Treponema sp.]|jgi:membrane-associated phospholipid phosphatase|nr:phosphatase PAP2 family protein [Treponema sp.]